jgi:hypothetical protein
MHPSGTASSPRESGLPAQPALFRRGRPLLLGAWAGVWKLPDWKFLPKTDYYSQTEQNEKKESGHKKGGIVLS